MPKLGIRAAAHVPVAVADGNGTTTRPREICILLVRVSLAEIAASPARPRPSSGGDKSGASNPCALPIGIIQPV